MTRPNRRTFLGMIAVGSIGMAGCLTVGASDDKIADDVVDQEITTVDTGCGTPDDDDRSTDIDGEIVTIEGVRTAPNPCHDAVISEVALKNGTLKVTIDVEPSSGEDEVCIDCVGRIEYEAVLELDDEVEDVIVEHPH